MRSLTSTNVADVDAVADVDDASEDDVVAVDGDVVTAAVEEAIALIDMKTSPEGDLDGRGINCAIRPLLQRGARRKQASKPRRNWLAISASDQDLVGAAGVRTAAPRAQYFAINGPPKR